MSKRHPRCSRFFCFAQHGRSRPICTDFTVTIRCFCATQPFKSGAAANMSRRVRRPLRPGGRSPEGRTSYRGSQAERPQAYRPGGKPPARFPAAPARRSRKAFVPEPRRSCGRAAAAADQGSDRRRHRGREQHARRPLSRGALSRTVVLPHPAHRPQRRAARQRQARRQQGPAGRRPERSHSAAQARYAEGRGTALGSGDQDAASTEGNDPVRGCRRDGAEQARGTCGAGRLRHHAECRSDAGSDARRQGAEAAAGASARQGNRRAACWSPRRALPRPR